VLNRLSRTRSIGSSRRRVWCSAVAVTLRATYVLTDILGHVFNSTYASSLQQPARARLRSNSREFASVVTLSTLSNAITSISSVATSTSVSRSLDPCHLVGERGRTVGRPSAALPCRLLSVRSAMKHAGDYLILKAVDTDSIGLFL
jgi:hypothetical protein